jgi:hypothetical protein
MRLRCISLCFLLLATSAGAQTWDVGFARLGPNGRVRAILTKGDSVIIGGEFTSVGGVAVRNLALWNGTRWSSLGGGTSGPVRALAANADGIFVGGAFDSAGTLPVKNIALLTRDGWEPLGLPGEGLPGTVNAIAAAPGSRDVYVGGDFMASINGTTQRGIARWTGSQWSGLGGGVRIDGAEWGEVFALAATSGFVYVGGHFNAVNANATELRARGVARWDLASGRWRTVADGIGGPEFIMVTVEDFAVDGPLVYAVGTFESAGDAEASNIARFSESTDAWESVDLTGLMYGSAVATRNEDVYAGTASDLFFPTDALVSWDSRGAWKASGAGIRGTIDAIEYAPNGDLYVGGAFATARGEAASNIIRRTTRPLASVDVDADGASPMIGPISGGTLSITLPRAGDRALRVSVHDVLGRALVELEPGTLVAGRHRLAFDVPLPRVVLVSVSAGAQVESRVVVTAP